MVRRRWLIAQTAFAAILGVLAFPGAGLAFAGVPILLTATGPSPAVLTISAAGEYPFWINTDTVPHTVAFADGRCTLQVAPGATGSCSVGFPLGTHAYTVDGTVQASVVVNAAWRKVTLSGRRHEIAEGGSITLHGRLRSFVPLPSPGPPAPVIVLARPDRMHPFHRVGVARAKLAIGHGPLGRQLRWHLRVRPRTRTIYIAEVNSAPQIYQRAWSKSFRVRVVR